MRAATIILATLLAAGCASTKMKQYVGKDIREVILDDGPPMHVLDLPDGTRAFQYPFGGGTYTAPTVTTTTGNVSRIGSQAWLSATSISSGGGTVTMPPCTISYIATWDGNMGGWIVRDYRIPKQMFC
jgi:hypothetical protein